MKFTELDLDERLMRGIRDLGFTDCTDVQAETFTHTLNGRDVAVQSQTGTGKTAAFLISIFQLWITEERFKDSKALVVAPTRELAVQIERDARAIGKYLPFKMASFYGGVGYGAQEKAVADGVDLIIGTPGRLLDFNQSGKIDFRDLGILVIDEADRLFDMGFYPDIRKIMRRARPREERVTMLYSATLSVSVRNISWQFMNGPAEIEIAPEQMTVEKVDQLLYHVSKDEKFRLLLGVLKERNPDTALIFCNTKRATEIVAKKLQLNGYACEFIMGDLPQKKRIKIIDSMKSGELRMLCATDVAARGLHVDDLDLVVNYDLPEDPEAYVHRIGRTARAGKTGHAVSLACERFVYSLEPIQELIAQKIPVATVTANLIGEDQSAGKHLHTQYRDAPQHRRGGDRRHPSGRPRQRSGGYDRDSRSDSGGRGDSRSHSPGGRGGARHPGSPKRAAADTRVHEPAARSRAAEGRGQSDRGQPDRGQPDRGHTGRGQSQRGQSERGSAPRGGDRGPSRATSVEERLAYYRDKYGEDFSGAGSGTSVADGNSGRGRKRGQQENAGTGKNRGSGHSGRAPRAAAQNTSGPKTAGTPRGAEKAPSAGEDQSDGGGKGLFKRLFGRKDRAE